jgi:hypothetical protein
MTNGRFQDKGAEPDAALRYVLTESQIQHIVQRAVDQGARVAGEAAVSDIINLLGRKTLRNLGIAVAAAGTLAVNWLIHKFLTP